MADDGSRYILTVSDYFTKWVDAIATVDKSASTVAASLFKVCQYRAVCARHQILYVHMLSLILLHVLVMLLYLSYLALHAHGFASSNYLRSGERIQ